MTRPTLPAGRAFWAIGATMVMILFTSAAPSPLYPVYQQLWSFSPFTLTLVFAIYVVTMLVSLLTVGSLSDHVGRRPVLAVALSLLIVSMILFATADGVGLLMAARAVQGLATGAALGTLTATLVDLAPTDRHSSAVSGAAPSAGIAGGVLVAGILVQYAPAPRLLVYVASLVVFAALLVLLAVMPETSARAGFTDRAHLIRTVAPRASVPARTRGVFVAAVPALVATWSLGGLYLSLGSTVVTRVFGVADHATAGLLLFVFFASAAVASVVLTGRAPATKLAYGYPALAVGAAVSLVGIVDQLLPCYVVGSVIAGTGFAGAFLGALDTIAASAPAADRGRVFSAVFVVSYLGFSVPAVISGLVVTHVGLRPTVAGYVAVVITLAIVGAATGVGTTRVRRRPACACTPRLSTPSCGGTTGE